LRQQILELLGLGVFAALLALMCLHSLRIGQVLNLFAFGSDIDRAREPRTFWFAWSVWAVMALIALGGVAWKAWEAIQHPDRASLNGPGLWLAVIAIGWFPARFLYSRLSTLWRRGPPWSGALRRERELGKLIRSLVDDTQAVHDYETFDETFDTLLKYSDFDFLERVAAHLASQSPPRSLRLALDELDPPMDDAKELRS
jgi:hypothetical protein